MKSRKNIKKILSLAISLFVLLQMAVVYPIPVSASGNAVYVSEDGVIENFNGTVYTTIESAISALSEGDGTVYLEGIATLPATPDLSKHAGKTLKFVGFNNVATGNVIQFENATKSFIPTGSADIVFENITVKHADGSTTEDWIFPSGGSITFGENCLYEHGYRADKDLDLRMYIGSYQAENGGTINFNSANVEYAEIGSIAGYIGSTSSNFTTAGDVTYNFNAGVFAGDIYGGMRNSSTGFATLNGDVYYNFNGGDFSKSANFAMGNLNKGGIINGNIIFTFNGGKFNRTLLMGSAATVTDSYTAFGNMATIINADSILEGGQAFTLKIADKYLPTNYGKRFVIINNSEDLASNSNATVTVSSTTLDYYLSVSGGKLTPVFAKSSDGTVGSFMGFSAVPDTKGYVPAVSEKPLTKNSAGYYAIESSASLQEITFVEEEKEEEIPIGTTVYVSADGVIENFDGTVYTSVSEALKNIGSDGGTLFVEGTVVFPQKPDTSSFAGKTLNVCGYGNSATDNVVELYNGSTCLEPTAAANIVFDKITMKRQDGQTNEAWISSGGGTITFGSGCLYKDGVRTTNQTALKMYLGIYNAAKGGTINLNSANVEYAEVGSIAGYVNSTSSKFTTAGDVIYNFNAGVFAGGIYGGMRNSSTGFATLNGDVYYNFNGATLASGKTFATGNLKNGVINGNMFFTFNGGNINRNLRIGPTDTITEDYSKIGNTVVTFNGDKIALDGQNFAVTVSEGNLPKNSGKSFVIINHLEKLDTNDNASVTVSSSSLNYYIQCIAGSVTPVFEKSSDGNIGEFLGFDIISDTEGLVPAISGKKLNKNDNGYYHIDSTASVQTIEFAREEDLISTITLKSNLSGQTDVSAQYSNGDIYTLPECPFTTESGYVLACWTSGGKDFFPGDSVEIMKSMTFEAKYVREDSPYVFYVDTENGSDSADGLCASTAFLTLGKAVSAINSANIAEGRIRLSGTTNYKNLPAHSKNITIIGKKFTAGTNRVYTDGKFTADSTIVLSGDTVFDAVALSGNTVYTAGNTVKFTEDSEEVVNVKLVLSDLDKASSGNGAILDGGSFSHVLLSETTDTENTYLSIGTTCKTIKKLTLGGYGGKVENLTVSLSKSPILVWSAGDSLVTGNILFYVASSDKDIRFKLDKTDFDAEKFIHVQNVTEEEITLSSDNIFTTPDGKYFCAMGQEHVFYPVDRKMSVTEAGEYKIREVLGEGADYFPYPKIPEGKYFDKWEKIVDGHLEAVFTDEEKLLSYYVSENGSDNNCGTSTVAPFESLAAAVNALDGKDGRVVIMDTVYWSENSSSFNVPAHSGTITFEGLSADNFENQIIDYSRSTDVSSTTGSLRLQGDSIFKNLSFRAHHYNAMYTNGYDLSLEGKIGYIKGVSGNEVYTLVTGTYASAAENARVYLGADFTIGTLNIGHNTSSSITGETRIIIDGTNIDNLVLCGTGATLNNVDIVYVKGNVGNFTTSSSTGAEIAGDFRIVRSNGSNLVLDNAANITPAGKIYEYNCEEGIFIIPVGTSKTLFRVLSDITIKAENKDTGSVYYSSKGGYIGLPEGSYTITKASEDIYTNNGDTITILKETSLNFDEYLYRNEYDGIFAGWCYDGKTTGPVSGEILPAGTVLKANYVSYDPAGSEFGIIDIQIRVADSSTSQGLRFIINKDNSFDQKFNIIEYGAVILPKTYLGESELQIGGQYVYNNKTYYSKYVQAKNIFKRTENGLLYTICLTGTDPEKYNNFYITRACAVCKSANGGIFIVYSDPISSSFVEVIRNNQPKGEADAAAFQEIVTDWKNTYFGEGITTVTNSKYETAYTVNSNGVSVREITIDSGKDDGKTVQIAMITDSHLRSDKPGSVEALDKAMICASFADQVVLCGDNVESVSNSANMNLLKAHVWDIYPDTIATLGNHEYFYPGSGSMDDLKAKVDDLWPHDPDYYSRLIRNKVLVVTADNARQIEYGQSVYYFTEEKCEKLEADIEYARKNGYTILFFCHVSLSSLDKSFMANGRMYDLITSNADVIKGCFSGHGHADDTSTLSASYLDADGNEVAATIPYYWLRGCAEDNYQGHVLYINVE